MDEVWSTEDRAQLTQKLVDLDQGSGIREPPPPHTHTPLPPSLPSVEASRLLESGDRHLLITHDRHRTSSYYDII